MNKDRRKRLADLQEKLDALLSDLQEVAEEEREYFDNMPESIQQGERGDAADEAAGALEDAAGELENLIGTLQGASEA